MGKPPKISFYVHNFWQTLTINWQNLCIKWKKMKVRKEKRDIGKAMWVLLSRPFYWKMYQGQECKSLGCCNWLKSHQNKVCELGVNNPSLKNTVLPSFNPSYNTLLRYLFLLRHIKRDYCLYETIPGRYLSSSGTFVTQSKTKSDLTCSCHCFYFRLSIMGFCFSLGCFFFPPWRFEHGAQIATRMEKLQSWLKLNNTEDLLVWLPSSSNFYRTPTAMWLWCDLPVQHSHTSQSCFISPAKQ